MEITGKIILELPERSGISARTGSEWRLKSFVLETMEQYPRKMQFEVFGSDRIAQMNLQVGEVYTISFDIDAREYQGRWYNSIRAFRAMPGAAAMAEQPMGQPMMQQPMPQQPYAAQPAAQQPFAAQPVAQQPMAADGDSVDDLPF